MNQKRKTWIWHIITLLLGIAILVAWVWYSDPSIIVGMLLDIDILFLLIGIGVYSMTWVFRTLRYKFFISEFALTYSYWSLFQVQISGFALNNLLPAKLGDVATVAMLKLKGATLGQAAAIVLQSRLLDLVLLLLMVIPVVFKTMPNAALVDLKNGIIVVSAFVMIIFLFFILDIQNSVIAMVKKNIIKDKESRLGKMITKVENLLSAVKILVQQPSLLFATLFCSAVIWFLESLSSFFVLQAVGWQGSLWMVMLVVALSNLAKTIPITPGGIGLYESAWAGILIAFGFPVEIALVSGMLDHFMKKAFNLSIGLPLAVKWSVGLNTNRNRVV